MENNKEFIETNNFSFPSYYASYSRKPSVVKESSSGGIFFELAIRMLEKGGVVYGAAWKSVKEVAHIRVEKDDELKLLQKSKYVRSSLDGIFNQVEEDLKQGIEVLFSGTPCQIVGLYKYLGRHYSNLLTVEVVCHGIPIKEAYLKYVQERELERGSKLVSINFRNKIQGWKNNSISETFSDGEEVELSVTHPHHSIYLKGINVEKRCGTCEFASLPRKADITLADFWEYEGELLKNDNQGISLVVVNNLNGYSFFKTIIPFVFFERVKAEKALESCRHLSMPPKLHVNQSVFEEMIKKISFRNASLVCSKYGEVVKKERLVVLEKGDIDGIFRAFMHDSGEVVYIAEDDIIVGIVTFGVFLANYLEGKEYINNDYKNVSLMDSKCYENIAYIFDNYPKINRIPIFADDNITYEVRRSFDDFGTKDERRFLLPFYRMALEKRKCFFFKRPDYVDGFDYGEERMIRISNHLSFPVLAGKKIEAEYISHLRHVLNNKFTEEYVDDLCVIPPIIKKGNRFIHLDIASNLINVTMGERKTCYQPKKWKYTVHVYGRCGVFGYAVEDADTLPSQLQKILKDKEIRVVSHSTWGAEDGHIIQNINEDLIDGVIDVHDIIIFYMNYLPNIDLIRNLGVYVYDSTEMFHKALMQGVVDFYDIPGHMNAEGYRVISRIIYDEICGDIDNQLFRVEQAESKKNAIRGELLDEPQKLEVSNYIEQIKSKLPAELLMNSIVGAIVMNCNPFTRGHRYLIEEALKSVGVLIIFVVQEDNSDFSFEDRYNMVKCGTSDLKNVFVFPSGRFIVSSFTLPDYVFKKTSKSVVLDMNLDVEIFARYIAPSLNISYRFVGTEPNDIVTARYNETQKNIFEKYGIHLVVIKRLEVNSAIVSASVARKLIKEGRETEIYDYLPDSSVNYLRAHGFFEGGC